MDVDVNGSWLHERLTCRMEDPFLTILNDHNEHLDFFAAVFSVDIPVHAVGMAAIGLSLCVSRAWELIWARNVGVYSLW